MNDRSNHCSTSTTERACILHNDAYEISNQPVQEITESSWQKIYESSLRRKSKTNFEDSIYSSIVLNLPDEPTVLHGYHSICYQRFTAVKLVDERDQEDNRVKEKCSFEVPTFPRR